MAVRSSVLMLVLAALLLSAAPSFASRAGDVRAGRDLSRQIDRGSASCASLDARDFRRTGEYVMERMTGSATVHAAMDERMESMIGGTYAERMHELLGRRWAGCRTSGAGPMMMGGAGPMMRGADTAWMRDGAWRRMDRAAWERMSDDWIGPGMRHSTGSWTTGAVVAAVIGGILVALLLALFLTQRPGRRPPEPGPAT